MCVFRFKAEKHHLMSETKTDECIATNDDKSEIKDDSIHISNADVKSNDNDMDSVIESWIPVETPNSEGLTAMNTIGGVILDNRLPAPFSDINKTLNSIGCLKPDFVNCGGLRQGTGIILDKYKYSDEHKCKIWYGLTCAHNLIIIHPYDTNTVFKPDYITFEIRNNIKDHRSKVIYSFPVIKSIIHPKYKKPEFYSGYDIALFEIKDKKDVLQNMKHVPLKSVDYKHTKIAKVIGYPGKFRDEIKTNWMYGMIGNYEISPNNINLLQYKNIQTSGGQSGSPIFGISSGNNDTKSIYQEWNNANIIGIHTGTFCYNINVGTYITKDMLKWISKTTSNHKITKVNTNTVNNDDNKDISNNVETQVNDNDTETSNIVKIFKNKLNLKNNQQYSIKLKNKMDIINQNDIINTENKDNNDNVNDSSLNVIQSDINDNQNK